MKIKIPKLQIWIVIFYVNVILCTINFFVTANPYSAYHSGRAGYESNFISIGFRINPAGLLLGSLIIISGYNIIKYGKIICSKIGLFFCFLILLVSLGNMGVISETKTVIYNILSIMLTSILIAFSHQETTVINEVGIKKLYYFITILLLGGIIFALMFPNRYGIINIDFSRNARGEITYWLFIGLQIWSVVIALTMYYRHRKKLYLIPIVIVMFFQLAFANRMAIIVITIPLLVYIFTLGNKNEKILLIMCIVGIIGFFGNDLINMFFLGNSFDITTFSNGRFPLWSFYISEMKKHWLCGAGPNLSSSSFYLGSAFSEIGVLKWFGEYGIVVGGFQLCCIIVAFIKSLKLLKNISKNYMEINYTDLIMSFYYIACFVPFLLESYGRILNLTDFFAWFSMYYILEKKEDNK